MARPIKDPRPKRDLEADAAAALEAAGDLPPGPERTAALRRAGILRNAVELQGLFSSAQGSLKTRPAHRGGNR